METVFFFGKSITTLDKIFIFGREGIKNAKLVVFQSWDHHAGHSKKRCWDYHFNIGNFISHGFTGSRTKIVSMLLWFLSLTHCSLTICLLFSLKVQRLSYPFGESPCYILKSALGWSCKHWSIRVCS